MSSQFNWFRDSLALHLVAEDGRRRPNVERFDLAAHRDAHQEVTTLRHQRPHTRSLATQHEADGPGEVDLPGRLPSLYDAPHDPDALFLQNFKHLNDICLPGDRQMLHGTHG